LAEADVEACRPAEAEQVERPLTREDTTQWRERLAGIVLQVRRLAPGNRLRCLDDENRLGVAVGEVIRYLQAPVPLEGGPPTDERLAEGGVGLGPRAGEASGIAVGHRPARQQGQVVRAVPRLIEPELLVEFLFVEVRQDKHPPTEQPPSIRGVEGC